MEKKVNILSRENDCTFKTQKGKNIKFKAFYLNWGFIGRVTSLN